VTPKDATAGRGGIFYGWFVLVGVMLIIFVVGGSFVNSFGVLLPIVCEEFGWSRAIVSGALSLGILCFGLPSPLYGIFVKRFGPRFTCILGNLLAGIGIAGVSLVQDVWHLYFFYVLIGVGGGFGGYIAATTVINNWFIKKRSLALGIFAACSGMGGLVYPPFTTALAGAVGWRSAWLILGSIIVLAAVLIGSVLLIRNRPEDRGLQPDGEPGNPLRDREMQDKNPKGEPSEPGITIGRVLKQRTAWLIGGLAAANAFTMGTMMTHQIAYLQDIGFQAITAASTMSFMSVFGIIGSLLFGALAMRVSVRYLASAAFIVQIIGLSVLLLTRELTFIFVFAACQGLSNGALQAALPTFVGAYYERGRYAQVIGVVFPFQVTSNAVSAAVAGMIFDATTSYTAAFAIAVAFSAMGVVFAFTARRPRSV